jgi:UDP-N-acetyl-D-glucosamine dehydrogenase
MMCDLLGVDVYEVIDAAATKPFGLARSAARGHCIPMIHITWQEIKASFWQVHWPGS